MAISWLSALKVVPWGKVIEHAPGVLDKARNLIDKHRGSPSSNTGTADPQTTVEVPSLGELNNRCVVLQAQLEQQMQTQQQMAQTLADMAEQQAGMIAMVKRLQSRLWWLCVALVMTAIGGVVVSVLK